MFLGACGVRTAHEPPLFEEIRTNAGAHRGVAIVTDDNETSREAAEALAAPLAGACSAEALGIRGSMEECRAAARECGVERLVTCRVIEYDPYDPQRLVVGLAVEDAGCPSRMSADEVMALGRGIGGARPRREARRRPFEKTVSIDLATRTKSWMLAYAAEIGLGESPEDLLEAEILLRDPARFFPFAARHIARQVPTGSLGPAPRPSETPSAPSLAEKAGPKGSHTLGALGDLR